jgi:hypothetical protein
MEKLMSATFELLRNGALKTVKFDIGVATTHKTLNCKFKNGEKFVNKKWVARHRNMYV